MRSFGPYTNLIEIGRGGMATVFRATAPDGHLVALKILAVHLADDRTARTRFEQESALGLSHPNIVGVRRAGVEGDTPFIEMDYVPGESLDRLIVKNGPLTPAQFVPILNDAAAALDFAHGHNVIHRDVKPSNIIIRGTRDDARAMLADFGVAKAANMTAFTATQARVGSVYYMSPEQASGSIDLTKATDIYSLGVTAFYALTGKHPFEGDNEIAVARMHTDRQPPHISDINPKVPRHIGDVVMRALQKQPLRRPATAGAFANDFATAIASPAPPVVPASQAVIVQPAVATTTTTVPPARVSPTIWAVLGLALALIVFAGLGAWLLRPSDGGVNGTPAQAGVTVVPSTATFVPLPPDQVLTPASGAPPATTIVIVVQTAVPQTYPTWTPAVIVYPTATSAPAPYVPPAPLPNVTSPVNSPIALPTPAPISTPFIIATVRSP